MQKSPKKMRVCLAPQRKRQGQESLLYFTTERRALNTSTRPAEKVERICDAWDAASREAAHPGVCCIPVQFALLSVRVD